MAVPAEPLAARIAALLPQTQCTRCGYRDCAAYADAIADGTARIDRCPPGGDEGVRRLAALTGSAPLPLDPDCGTEGPRGVAVIDEDWCIGCTLCLDACPTDAILGRSKRMHTVIDVHCTGCELCIPVCPVDCIDMVDANAGRTGWAAWSQAQADAALSRYRRHMARRPNSAEAQATQQSNSAPPSLSPEAAFPTSTSASSTDRKQAVIAAALARARARRV